MLHFTDAQKLTRPTAFTTMIKPVGSACNLDCDYCYYLGKADLYGGRQPKMSDELLERYISQYIEAVQVPVVTFCWHGGEPLLAGIDFYEKAVALQNKYRGNKHHKRECGADETCKEGGKIAPFFIYFHYILPPLRHFCKILA